MPPNPAPPQLDALMSRAEGYAQNMMREKGRVPPTLFTATPSGALIYVPQGLADVQAKNNFANTARLICAAHAATAAVMVLESWATFAKRNEMLDDTPPSEAFDRREFVVLMGEASGVKKQKLLPIIRTDAGGFFGFAEFDAPAFDDYRGRFTGLLPPKAPTAEQRALARAALAALGVTDVSLRSGLTGN